jgi:hypothetical protein
MEPTSLLDCKGEEPALSWVSELVALLLGGYECSWDRIMGMSKAETALVSLQVSCVPALLAGEMRPLFGPG